MEQEKKVQGSLVGAFVVGGCIAVAMQVVMMLLSSVLPAEASAIVPAISLIILGLVGMVLVLTGVYAKLNEIGGYGAAIMFCGLVDAASGIFVGETMANKGDRSAGVKGALKFAVAILGSIIVVGTVLGLALGAAGNPGAIATATDATPNPGPISLLYAFLCAGIISIVGQAMLENTPLPLPAVILIEGAIGALTAVFGLFGKLEALCGAGLICTVVDAGGSMVAGGTLISIAGAPQRTVITIIVMAIVVLIGIVTGNILVNRIEAQQK